MNKLDHKTPELTQEADVTLFEITQATTAVFADLYFRMPFLFFIKRGEKKSPYPMVKYFWEKQGT